MRFLITGCAGFVGSHLAEAMLAHKHEVHVLDETTVTAVLGRGAVDHRSPGVVGCSWPLGGACERHAPTVVSPRTASWSLGKVAPPPARRP